MRLLLLAWLSGVLVAVSASAGPPALAYGDVLVSTSMGDGPSKILVYSRDAVFKGELASVLWTLFRETIYRDGEVYVGTVAGIWNIDSAGALSKFGDIRSPVWLAPTVDGSIVAANNSGELYVVNRDGSLRLYRDTQMLGDVLAAGIEVTSDQCAVYYAGSAALVLWDVCRNTKPSIVGPVTEPGTRAALRLLPDGTFLAAYRTGIYRLDAGGNVTRNYPIPTHGLALDVDRTSFWAGAGSTLLRVDIESGAVLSSTNIPLDAGGILFLGVVGEPRAALQGTADIPTLSMPLLFALALALLFVAAVAIRQ